jgi:hypothetical protein
MGLPLAQDRLVQLLDHLGGRRDALRGRPVQREIGPVDVAEHQAVVGRDRRLGVRDGIARQRGQVLDGLVEEGDRLRAARPDRRPPAISECLAQLGPPTASRDTGRAIRFIAE